MSKKEPIFLNRVDAAKRVGLTESYLSRLEKNPEFASAVISRLSERKRLFDLEALRLWIKNNGDKSETPD